MVVRLSREVDITVLIVTFNHAGYIASAVDSVLAQKTDFSLEILISEDASTDQTCEIVRHYAAAHPERIRLLLSQRNLRSNEVVRRGLRAARGRYLALLDGDDFWIDEGKLQRQAAFLEDNPSCTAVFHNAKVAVGDRLTDSLWTRSDLPPRLTSQGIWQGNPFATCSGMMRTHCVCTVSEWYNDFFPITDWPLYILCAEGGDLAFINEAVGVYRLHDGGLHSALPTQAKLEVIEKFYRRMRHVNNASFEAAARSGGSRYFFDWAMAHLRAGDITAARSCFRRSLRAGGIGLSVSKREALRLGLSLLRPAGEAT